MKVPSVLAVSILLASAALGLRAQDAGFRSPDVIRRSANQAAPAVADDSSVSASKISSMEVLDDSRPLQVGDTISLRVVEDRDRVQSLMVQDSGNIQAPHIGLVKTAGRTCKAVALFMKKELEKHYFQQATVIVALEKARPTFRGPSDQPGMDYFVVYGQVGRQGKYELGPEEELTVSQAILRAGGFSQFAKKEKVKLIRKTPKGNVTIQMNLDDVMRKGHLEKDIPIRPNDVLIVDEKLINI